MAGLDSSHPATESASSPAAGAAATLVAATLGFFVVTLDAVILNVALPDIRADLGGGIRGLQWVVDGYTLIRRRTAHRSDRGDQRQLTDHPRSHLNDRGSHTRNGLATARLLQRRPSRGRCPGSTGQPARNRVHDRARCDRCRIDPDRWCPARPRAALHTCRGRHARHRIPSVDRDTIRGVRSHRRSRRYPDPPSAPTCQSAPTSRRSPSSST
jgi:hypothetical protein